MKYLLIGLLSFSVSAADFRIKVENKASLASKGIMAVTIVNEPFQRVLISLTDEVDADLQNLEKGNVACVVGSVLPDTTSILVRAIKNCL